MIKSMGWAVVAIAVFLTGCGPDTIFVRPYLDTPEQHLAAGHQLLERGKYDDACREFMHARVLMAPNYVSAYVGLGLALGYKGEFEEGEKSLNLAREMAVSEKDKGEVAKGFERFEEIRRNNLSEDQANTPSN